MEYADHGGKVLFLGYYPEKSAEFSKDGEVKKLVDELKRNTNVHFIDDLDERKIEEFIRTNIDLTVRIDQVKAVGEASPEYSERPESFRDADCAFNVIHKIKDGMDFFFFGNPTDCGLTAEISFRTGLGKGKKVELWNPHTGKTERLRPVETRDGRLSVTLPLEPVQSRFMVFR
ncbi:MAG: hypothetical protein LBJ01_11875, partial [Tannerella sp.]|jgi:hypothetical protein|nr:hypothetical protein [Tannerella sp.]